MGFGLLVLRERERDVGGTRGLTVGEIMVG